MSGTVESREPAGDGQRPIDMDAGSYDQRPRSVAVPDVAEEVPSAPRPPELPERRAKGLTVLTVAVTLCLLGVIGAACGDPPSSGAPTRICGVTVAPGAEIPPVWDMWHQNRTVTEAGGTLYVRLTKSCSDGATLTIRPPSAFRVRRVVKGTRDGWVAVLLKPLRSESALLAATRHNVRIGSLHTHIEPSSL